MMTAIELMTATDDPTMNDLPDLADGWSRACRLIVADALANTEPGYHPDRSHVLLGASNLALDTSYTTPAVLRAFREAMLFLGLE